MKYRENSRNRMKAIFSASQAEGRGFESRFPLVDNQEFSLVTGQAPDFCLLI